MSLFFSFVLFNTNDFFIVSIGSIYGIHERRRAGTTRTTRTGPNDASRVVWALGELFFFFPLHITNTNDFFIESIGIYKICERERAGTTKMGPNDVSRVV